MPIHQVTNMGMKPPTPAAEEKPGAIRGMGGTFGDMIHELDTREKLMDRVIKQALHGKDFSPGELIAIQSGVYRYTQQLEAFSKLVDRTTGAIRRTLETGG